MIGECLKSPIYVFIRSTNVLISFYGQNASARPWGQQGADRNSPDTTELTAK